jgi:site-specific DNA recombinase
VTAIPLRAAILARVSSDTQLREGLGLSVQLDKGRAVIAGNGWTPAGEFVDEGVTGTMLDRPAVRALLAECQAGRVDMVVMAAASRMARDEVVDAQLRKALYDAGVAVCINGQVFQPTKEGMLNLGIQGVVAAYQRRDLIDTMAAGQHKRAEVGGWPGGPPPFGIRLAYPPRPDGGKPKPVPELDDREARVLREAWRLIVTEGRSTWQAAAELNTRPGYHPRTSPRWTHNNLRRILMRPALVGQMTWGKPPKPGTRPKDGKTHRATGRYGQHAVTIPAIFTQDEYDQLQAELARSTTPTPAKSATYLLSGRGHQHLIMACGGAAHGVHDRRPGRTRQYRCWHHRSEEPERCGCLNIDADELESWVRTYVLALLQNPGLLDEAIRRALSELSESSATAEQPDELDRRIGQLERALAGAYEAGLRGGLDPQALAAATRTLSEDLAALRGRRERMVLAQAAEADRQARLRALPGLADQAVGWDAEDWRAFIARWDIHVHVVKWLTTEELAQFPEGMRTLPYVVHIEGLLPREMASEAPRCWTCCRPPTPVTAVS